MIERYIRQNARQPWLTILMPSHRGEQWIDTTLRSVAAEADDGLEIIIIDSSPDTETLHISRRFADSIRLRFYERPDVLGWPTKMNLGMSLASATHVCLLHQDDVWLPGRAAAVRSWIELAPEAALHLAPTAIIDTQGRKLGTWHCPLPTERPIQRDLLISRLLVQNFVAIPTPVFTKTAWESCGGMDQALWYTADWDLWLKLASYGPVIYHEEVTTGFRIHAGSLTVMGSRNLDDFTSQMETVLNRHLPLIGENSRAVERAARASIAVNTALASASAGSPRFLWRAASEVLSLGPYGLQRYLRDSRLVERVAPRVRAKLKGAF